jgi:integrase
MASGKRANGDGSVFKRGSRWWIAYHDENGERKTRTTGMTERRLAERVLQAELDRLVNIRAGVIDPKQERLAHSGRRSMTELSEAYGAMLRAQGRTEPYVRRTEREIREFADAQGITTLNEITAESAAAYMDTLTKAGQSARTRQCRITSVKALTRWAWREGLLPADPLAGLRRPNPETDRRMRRRMLQVEEWRWLESTTLNAPTRFGMSGEQRALLFAVAIQTGLRSGELRGLTRASLHLSAKRPYIRVEAGGTKNRCAAQQYLRAELAERLVAHAAQMAPGAPVFRLPDAWDMAAMLREDLADARQAWIDAVRHDAEQAKERTESDFLTPKNSEGRTLDFHALRHTCGAWAAMGGASPKAMQTLMRHSTITLTLDTYGHLLPGEAAETVEKMPGFDSDEASAATGTADARADCSNRARNAGTIERQSMRDNAKVPEDWDESAIVATIGVARTCDDSERVDAGENENGPARIRTGDRAIMSRVL